MVLLNLKLKIISDKIKEILIEEIYSYTWCFKIECSHCFTEHQNEVYFTEQDEVENEKGHGTTNFMMKCKNCTRLLKIGINNKSNKTPYVIDCENGNDEGILCTFECRGCILKTWTPKEGILIKALETDTIFKDIDITNEWTEYDEANGGMVSLLEPITWTISEN
jgi:hypothetical protein